MKIAETPVSTQNTVYLKDQIREALQVQVGGTLEWHVENGSMIVRRKIQKK